MGGWDVRFGWIVSNVNNIYICVCVCVTQPRTVHAYAPLASSLFPQFARKKSFPVTDVPSRGAVIVCHQLNFACTLPYCTVRVQRKEKVCVCVREREGEKRERKRVQSVRCSAGYRSLQPEYSCDHGTNAIFLTLQQSMKVMEALVVEHCLVVWANKKVRKNHIDDILITKAPMLSSTRYVVVVACAVRSATPINEPPNRCWTDSSDLPDVQGYVRSSQLAAAR